MRGSRIFFSRRRGSDGYFSLPGILRHIFGNFIIMKIERNWNFARGMGCLDPWPPLDLCMSYRFVALRKNRVTPCPRATCSSTNTKTQINGLVWDTFTFCYNKFGTTNQYLKPPSHFLTDVSLLQDHVEKVWSNPVQDTAPSETKLIAHTLASSEFQNFNRHKILGNYSVIV